LDHAPAGLWRPRGRTGALMMGWAPPPIRRRRALLRYHGTRSLDAAKESFSGDESRREENSELGIDGMSSRARPCANCFRKVSARVDGRSFRGGARSFVTCNLKNLEKKNFAERLQS